MKILEKLSRLAKIDGFAGAAVLTPDGRVLLKCDSSDMDIDLMAFLANNVLRTAEKASRDMGLGRSQLTFIQTEKALVLARCLNESKNPLGTEPGKCHIHLILLIENPDSFGIARIEISRVIELLAENFRTAQEESGPNIFPHEIAREENTGTAKSLQEINESLHEDHINSTLDTLFFQDEG